MLLLFDIWINDIKNLLNVFKLHYFYIHTGIVTTEYFFYKITFFILKTGIITIACLNKKKHAYFARFCFQVSTLIRTKCDRRHLWIPHFRAIFTFLMFYFYRRFKIVFV